MLSYLESILGTAPEQQMSGGKTSVTLICYIGGTVGHGLIKFLEKKHLLYYKLDQSLPGLLSEVYSELQNTYYSHADIGKVTTTKLIAHIESKCKNNMTFILPLNRQLINLPMLVEGMNKSMTCNFYFLNLNTEGMFRSFYEYNTQAQLFEPPQKLLNRITVFYHKVESKTDKSILITRRSLKKYLEERKYFFSSEDVLNDVVKTFFSFYSEGGEELNLEFCTEFFGKSPPTIIDIPILDDLDKHLNEMKLN